MRADELPYLAVRIAVGFGTHSLRATGRVRPPQRRVAEGEERRWAKARRAVRALLSEQRPGRRTGPGAGGRRVLTAAEFQELSAVSLEAEWFANIDNPRTRRACRTGVTL